MSRMIDCYICNSAKDDAIVKDLRQYLMDKGLRPFVTPYDVPAGTIKAEAIMTAISRCSVCVVVVSEASIKSMRVLNEIAEATRNRKRCITFYIDGASMSTSMRYYLQAYESIDGPVEPRKEFNKLYNAVLAYLPSERQREISKPKTPPKQEKPNATKPPTRIFVSYSRKDKEIVYPLVQRIEQVLGPICWIDSTGVMSSERFIGKIREAIDSNEVVLYMHSDNAIQSQWTMKEISYAHSQHKRIVPVLLKGNTIQGDLAFMFADINFVPISQEGQEAKLIADLATMLGITEKPETKPTADESSMIRSQASNEFKKSEPSAKKPNHATTQREEKTDENVTPWWKIVVSIALVIIVLIVILAFPQVTSWRYIIVPGAIAVGKMIWDS